MPKFKLFKDRKGKADQVKNNQFVKLAREIFVAARQGGPNPEANFALKNAIDKARHIQMPNDNIERAIKKARGITIPRILKRSTMRAMVQGE
ncbi:YebC/PmpR family DNA-binding transcriptional regulator [Paenibacillus larvae]|nr:YebC/PmpR family DNA-binding transcriptional regulator [Paenibacillus larvae]MDT2258463.1 YebC/PmpR family DNA-binding transcriptional regulator [Paenibacillus larvae]